MFKSVTIFVLLIGLGLAGCGKKEEPAVTPEIAAVPAKPTVSPEIMARIQSLVGTSLINRLGEPVSPEVLAGKKIGLYFSADWSPPCRYFTPRLIDFYEKMRIRHEAFEIVLVPRDHSAQDQMIYMRSMKIPWPAIPYSDQSLINKLILNYSVNQTGIPLLVVIDADGTLITTEGRSEIMRKGLDAYDAW